MTRIPDTDWHKFDALKDDAHECDERCVGGVFINPIIPASAICECTHDRMAHYKGKKCRHYGCFCQKFVADES